MIVDFPVTQPPVKRTKLSPIAAPTRAEYQSAFRENNMLTTSQIAPCKRCGWPRVAECACNYCGSARP